MSERNDGGPAFPAAFSSHQPGMSLRDYFAAQAMQSLAANSIGRFYCTAGLAYEIADAMLEARKK